MSDAHSSSETERFELNLWDFAPDRWITEDLTHSFELAEAKIVGEPGSEELVLEVERSPETETDQEGSP